MAMHKDFGDWYREAHVVPDSDLLERRWAGVESLSSKTTAQSLQELLKLYCLPHNAESSIPDYFDKAFRDADAAFPTKSHGYEIRILAGAVLRRIIEERGSGAVQAALGIVCGSFGDRRCAVPFAGHIDAAEKFLTERAESIRKIEPINLVKETKKERGAETVLPAEHFANGATPNLRAPLITYLNEQAALAPTINATINALSRAIQNQREELNLLWWLQSRFSKELQQPLANTPTASACAVIAFELASLTEILPGPSAILGIIVQALNSTIGASEKISLASVVNEVPRQWREAKRIAQEAAVSSLVPITLSLARSLDTDGKDDWFPVYKKQCDVNLAEVREPSVIAYQLYTERLFLKSLSEMKK